MFVDFKKAFDSIEWEFLFKTLDKFNFGCDFQKWIKLLYVQPSAFVKNNGYLSEEFNIYCGVRQGCPVSALLFILCMEVLSCYLRQNMNIRGLDIDGNETKQVKIIQYADDATLFLRNVHEMREAILSLEKFGRVAGTKLNLTKCEGLWVGAYKNRQQSCTLCGIKWPTTPIRYLGIYIGHDSQQCYKLNFESKISNIDNLLTEAQKRQLTLFGKVCIIKSLAIAKMTYVSLCLTIPEKVIKEIDMRILRFLWGKRDRIKRKSIINEIEKGGLKMIDIRAHFNAIKAAWVPRIVNAPHDHMWSLLPKQYFFHIWK